MKGSKITNAFLKLEQKRLREIKRKSSMPGCRSSGGGKKLKPSKGRK